MSSHYQFTDAPLVRVTIYRDGEGWMLDHAEDPSAGQVVALFGTPALPMPFLRGVPESQVRDVIERLHPGVVVSRGEDRNTPATGQFDPEALRFRVNQERHGFLTDDDVAQLAGHPVSRLWSVLVRCGGCRFLTNAQDVQHLTRCVQAGGDYVRDYSFPAVKP